MVMVVMVMVVMVMVVMVMVAMVTAEMAMVVTVGGTMTATTREREREREQETTRDTSSKHNQHITTTPPRTATRHHVARVVKKSSGWPQPSGTTTPGAPARSQPPPNTARQANDRQPNGPRQLHTHTHPPNSRTTPTGWPPACSIQ